MRRINQEKPERINVQLESYKLKSTTQLSIIPAKFMSVADKDKKSDQPITVTYLDSKGVFLWSVTPHFPAEAGQNPKRDWSKTMNFAMTVQESYDLELSIRAGRDISFFHQPGKAVLNENGETPESSSPDTKVFSVKIDKITDRKTQEEKPIYYTRISYKGESVGGTLSREEMGCWVGIMGSLRADLCGLSAAAEPTVEPKE